MSNIQEKMVYITNMFLSLSVNVRLPVVGVGVGTETKIGRYFRSRWGGGGGGYMFLTFVASHLFYSLTLVSVLNTLETLEKKSPFFWTEITTLSLDQDHCSAAITY